MRICFIAEGCYPYVVGGVSSWVHSMIKNFPNQEFILLTIVANRDASGKFAYELPENVTEVHEVYLEDVDWGSVNRHNKTRLNKKEYQALRSLILNHEVEWDNVFEFFHKKNISLNQLLMGEDFYHAVLDAYNLQYPLSHRKLLTSYETAESRFFYKLSVPILLLSVLLLVLWYRFHVLK